MLSMHHVIQQGWTLSDGTMLPKGSHLCMPVNAIQNDPEVTSNPTVFDSFRYYKHRQKPGEGHCISLQRRRKISLILGMEKPLVPVASLKA